MYKSKIVRQMSTFLLQSNNNSRVMLLLSITTALWSHNSGKQMKQHAFLTLHCDVHQFISVFINSLML